MQRLVFPTLIWGLVGATAAHADAVHDWNAIAVNTAIANGQNPFAQARFAATTQLAVFEAVNAITREYEPISGRPRRPRAAGPSSRGARSG